MAELYREDDATRFDTEALQKISIDLLTCAQVEEYFAEAIEEGKTDDEEDDEVEKTPKEKKDKDKKDTSPVLKEKSSATKQVSKDEKISSKGTKATEVDKSENGTVENIAPVEKNQSREIADNVEPAELTVDNVGFDQKDIDDDHFWRSATMYGLLFGAGCLFMMSRAVKGMQKSGR